jgi:hypothetical protein
VFKETEVDVLPIVKVAEYEEDYVIVTDEGPH